MLNLRLLGGAAVEGPDGPVSGRVNQRARLALLAYLAAARGRLVPRERLIALIWPDADTEQARRLLRDSLYRLREALGDEAVQTSGDDVRLAPELIGCDLWEFEDAAASSDAIGADRRYAGPFLDGFFLSGSAEFDHWSDGERRRLEQLHQTVLERIAEAHVTQARWVEAIQVLRRLVQRDPSNARLTVKLMRALDASGDRAGALRQAAEHTRQMREEFDLAGDADVETFADRLRRDSSARDLLPPEDSLDRAAPGWSIAPVPNDRARRTARLRIAGVGVLSVIVLGTVAWYASRSDVVPLDENVVAVTPFRVAAPDTTHDYLSEGMVDLASVLLTGEGAPRAVDPRSVLAAYRRRQDTSGEPLTIAECLSLARRFGAGRLLTGEIVITADGATVTARLLDASTGRLIATHSEQGPVVMRLTTRLFAGVVAKSYGEESSRLSGLSDSVEALRAYLRGVQTYRGTQPWESFAHISRAMEIDPTFATAALWRAFLAGDAYIFGTPPRRRIDSVAWSLRGRLSRRDSLLLVTLPSIGPNYPEPSTARQLFQALERAAEANPDRIEVWDALASHLQMFGAQASIDGALERAVRAADHALALDSAFLPVLSLRTYLALLQGDSSDIRVHSTRFFSAIPDTMALHWRWAVARVLGDSSRMNALLPRVAERRGFPAWLNIELWAARYGLSSIIDAEQMGKLRLAASTVGPEERAAASRSLFRVATMRGRARESVVMADTTSRPGASGRVEAWEGSYQQAFITLGIVGPGFDDAAALAARMMESRHRAPGNASETANNLCLTQLWRVSRGDTSSARAAVTRMRELVQTIDPGPGWRVTRVGLCPLLVEAALEQGRQPPAQTPALDRAQALLLDGPQAEMPGNLARILVARWRERQGRYREALAVLRGADPMAWSVAAPALWLTEGRIAAMAADTAGAIHAYSQFLSLRDQPDPGPVADEVQWVRDQLSELHPETRRTPRR